MDEIPEDEIPEVIVAVSLALASAHMSSIEIELSRTLRIMALMASTEYAVTGMVLLVLLVLLVVNGPSGPSRAFLTNPLIGLGLESELGLGLGLGLDALSSPLHLSDCSFRAG